MSGLSETLEMLACAAIGAFANWLVQRYGSSNLKAADQFIDDLLDDFTVRELSKMLAFVIFGAIVGFLLVERNNFRQAIAAGMAWTSLIGGLVMNKPRKGRAS
jgi:hypothetical protein